MGFGLWKLYYSVDQIVKADKSACKDSFFFSDHKHVISIEHRRNTHTHTLLGAHSDLVYIKDAFLCPSRSSH